MKYTFPLIKYIFILFTYIFLSYTSAVAVTYADYEVALEGSQKLQIKGTSKGDGRPLDAYLYKPEGPGPFPALVALHGAGGIFPYQLWWAKEISKKGYVVIFIDHYCTRGHLCEVESGDEDPARGKIMKKWQDVSPQTRLMDAVAAYAWLSNKPYVLNNKIGLIGWSWGGTVALYAQKWRQRLSLPNGGFKATIAFYPNLKYALKDPRASRQWSQGGGIKQPTLILYGKKDVLESEDAYQKLISEDHSNKIIVIGFDGAYRKYDELGSHREKYHPSVGYFLKGFQQEAFDDSVREISKFLQVHHQ